MNFLKKIFALKKAKKAEVTEIPTLKDIKREDEEFRHTSRELSHRMKKLK